MTTCAATTSTSASLASLPEWLGLVLHPYIPDRCVARLSLASRHHHEALLPVWKQMLMHGGTFALPWHKRAMLVNVSPSECRDAFNSIARAAAFSRQVGGAVSGAEDEGIRRRYAQGKGNRGDGCNRGDGEDREDGRDRRAQGTSPTSTPSQGTSPTSTPTPTPTTKMQMQILKAHDHTITCVALVRDQRGARRILTGATDGVVKIWELAAPNDAVSLLEKAGGGTTGGNATKFDVDVDERAGEQAGGASSSQRRGGGRSSGGKRRGRSGGGGDGGGDGGGVGSGVGGGGGCGSDTNHSLVTLVATLPPNGTLRKAFKKGLHHPHRHLSVATIHTDDRFVCVRTTGGALLAADLLVDKTLHQVRRIE